MAAQVLAEVSSVLRKQQELMEKIENRPPTERRVEGITMPHYGGSLGESLELFLDQARHIDYTHEDNRKRVLAIMVSNLTGQAAVWYITQQHEITDITALAAALRREFIPTDLQECLRDSLYQLKQRECRDLAEYVTKYRQFISRVKDMGELDKITLFTRGLVSQTRAEVVYRRCSTVHQAINVAMEYERAHPIQLHRSRGTSRSAFQRTNNH
ncbi:hypothetical protein PHPALM_12642 [Phytophthora palmivora]|uniref:Ty3 transposon capsid-like protein domain-containing protein n=1 Tax=Phytophthora palmivora TaxID=4796 RepID=A0A2P4XZ82_9STRA|nr:hypothetical protein PHPALM_12642 [Phytophthora palmivora]